MLEKLRSESALKIDVDFSSAKLSVLCGERYFKTAENAELNLSVASWVIN